MCVWVCWWTTRTVSCEVAPGQLSHPVCHRNSHTNRYTSTLPPPLISSHSLSLFTPQQARQMAAPQPTVPGKACELKVIPSRSEELPASSRCGRGGGSSPPAFQALGHLAGVLWNDERAAANPCYCHHGRHRAERRSRRLFSFSALKWNKWAGVRLSGGLRSFARVHLCAISKQEDWVVVMPCIWMWWLVWATLAVRKVKVKSQNVAM